MWQSLWTRSVQGNSQTDYITNGIHVPTWIEPKMELLFNKYLGPEWLKDHDNPVIWEPIDNIPDQELWQVHQHLKIKLIDYIRERARKRWFEDKVDPIALVAEGTLLDPWTFTIGFARRFATYKRADLIFHDLERLKSILNNRSKPVQIIFAGKAHPSDDAGKLILQKVFNFAHDPSFGGRVAFVEDYGEQLAQYMVHGVDLWLNNPLPPMEACGTSGMKAALNGVPQLSILDGWWIEGFNGKNGWAFSGKGDYKEDSESVYNILEKDVVPLHYELDDNGIPHGWVKVMKESIKRVGPNFCSRRMVKEYSTRFYETGLKSALR